MADDPATNLFDAYFQLARAFMPVGIAAPDQLSQSILPGWSLISVNESNSSAPDTEQAVVAKASYGRQLGRILDALLLLVDGQPAAIQAEKPIAALRALAEEVEQAKEDAALTRIRRLQSDLALLKAKAPDDYARQREALMRLLAA